MSSQLLCELIYLSNLVYMYDHYCELKMYFVHSTHHTHQCILSPSTAVYSHYIRLPLNYYNHMSTQFTLLKYIGQQGRRSDIKSDALALLPEDSLVTYTPLHLHATAIISDALIIIALLQEDGNSSLQ